MRYHWKYLRDVPGDYNEVYLTQDGMASIKAEINRLQGRCRLVIDRGGEYRIESIISNGTVIRERDLLRDKPADLDAEFTRYHATLSSLPDSRVLRIIGGNYRVLTEFLGSVDVLRENPDIRSLKDLFHSLITWPLRTARRIADYLRAVLGWPANHDYYDLAMVSLAGLVVWLWNYDYMFTGIVVCVAALFSGYSDWFIRRRSPYVLKVILAFVPGLVAIIAGARFQ